VSHTFEGKKTRFHFNSDFSGDVTIMSGDKEIDVLALDVVDFVIEEFVKSTLITILEDVDLRKLLVKVERRYAAR
jgi:hypothetical protein